MKKIIVSVLFILIFWDMSVAQQRDFTIDGEIKTDSVLHGMIYIIGKGVKHDSIPLIENKYHFSGTLQNPGAMVYISWRDRPVSQQLKEKGTIVETGSSLVFLEPGKIHVEHDLNFKNIKVTGSQIHLDYDAMLNEVRGNKNNVDTVIKHYILEHPDSWLSFLNLKSKVKAFGPTASEMLYNSLSDDLKKNEEVAALGQQIFAMLAADIGKEAPGFVMQTPDGRAVSLEAYRGKYVLVDFWASWCAPCRAENPVLKGVYGKYKDRGLDILGVSLDLQVSRDKWVAAIRQDGLSWTQVSDLKGFDSPVAMKYGVHSIPANFLVDPSGKIVAMNLRGYALEQKMKEIFGNK